MATTTTTEKAEKAKPAAEKKPRSAKTPAAPKEYKYYPDAVITCACGAQYHAGSTMESIRVDICANCHPFYTGASRILDVEGRVDKFRKKYNLKKA